MLKLTSVMALVVGLSGCTNDSCESALDSMKSQIRTMCQETPFRDTPFCAACVPHGYYSVDDSCRCRVLNFDAEFCFYTPAGSAGADAGADPDIDGGTPADAGGAGARTISRAGAPHLRAALEHAAAVCEDRQPTLPRGELATKALADDDAGEGP